jgi:hypothetical protein
VDDKRADNKRIAKTLKMAERVFDIVISFYSVGAKIHSILSMKYEHDKSRCFVGARITQSNVATS